ncbi:MAG: hypothetical protein KJ561_01630, partial [Nanoarchaeota archaeon]|nr:hypothetical protein [Nanoarchaeota archaeon]
MVQETIKCPKCGEVIKVSQAISHDIEIELKKKYDKEILDIKETTARDLKDKESEIGDRLEKERVVLEEKLKKELKESQHIEVTDLQNQIKEKTKRLEEAEQNELILRKKQRALEEKEKKLELEMNRRLDNERKQITEKIHQEIEESHKLKDAEKAKQLE